MKLENLYPEFDKTYFFVYCQKRKNDLSSMKKKKEVVRAGKTRKQTRPIEKGDKITVTTQQKKEIENLLGIKL